MFHETINVLFHAPESSRRSVTHPSSRDHFYADLLTEIPDLVVADRPDLRLLRVREEESVGVRPAFARTLLSASILSAAVQLAGKNTGKRAS